MNELAVQVRTKVQKATLKKKKKGWVLLFVWAKQKVR
jgi:hypothetical protein